MPDANKNDKGRRAEDLVADYLRKKGYRILDRNARSRFGEIDLVAERDEVICFVEVRSRASDRFGRPAETVDRIKQSKLRKTAELYLSSRHPGRAARFDVASVVWRRQGEITYLEDAFE